MAARTGTGASGLGDSLSPKDALAFCYQNAGAVGIGAAVAILVRNDHIVAIAAGIIADPDHFAVMDGLDRCA